MTNLNRLPLNFCAVLVALTVFGALPVNLMAAEKKSDAPDLSAKDWKPLFDGKTLDGWAITDFAGHEKSSVNDGVLRIPAGLALSGVNVTGEPPKMNFELTLEARKIEGNDFFCCLTFPYGDSHCSFVVGGWGGGLVGISSIDGMDASENETADYMLFKKEQWYRISVRVTPEKIETWIDDTKMVDFKTEHRKVGMRFGEIEESKPLGIATWITTAEIRDIRVRSLAKKE